MLDAERLQRVRALNLSQAKNGVVVVRMMLEKTEKAYVGAGVQVFFQADGRSAVYPVDPEWSVLTGAGTVEGRGYANMTDAPAGKYRIVGSDLREDKIFRGAAAEDPRSVTVYAVRPCHFTEPK